MGILKKILRIFRMILFAFMLAVCMALGTAPVLSKRKQEIAIEINKEETEIMKGSTTSVFRQKN
jgi:hypothetical protein